MAVAWPSSLEQKVLVQGFGLNLGNTVLTSENEVGLPKERRRFTKAADRLQTSIIATRSEVTTFLNFYKTTLAGGTLSFDFTDPITDVTNEYKFDTQNPPQITPYGANDFVIRMNWIEIP